MYFLVLNAPCTSVASNSFARKRAYNRLSFYKENGKFEVVAVANRDLYETSSLDIRVEVHSLETSETPGTEYYNYGEGGYY